VQLIESTNRENYITLNSYQPLSLHRPYVKIHAFSAVWRRGLSRALPRSRAS
jgi:hypothetical protein